MTGQRTAISTKGLRAGYGDVAVLHGIDLDVCRGEVVVLLGPNGAGKTTTLLTLVGELAPTGGTVEILGDSTSAPLHRHARSGLAFIPESRGIFAGLTVAENIRLSKVDPELFAALAPELAAIKNRKAGLLSGGEQQLLSLARALATRPAALIADELSMGLAPVIVDRLLRTVRAAADDGAAVLLVEQNAHKALEIADRGYVLRRGRIELAGDARQLASSIDELEATYLAGDVQHRDRLTLSEAPEADMPNDSRSNVSDPLNSTSPPGVRWTTRNFSEAMPGVPTALSWSIWGPGMRFASIQVYRWMGVLSKAELAELERGSRTASDIFFGHVAGNIDVMSMSVARMPGASAASFERDFFGLEPSDRTPKSSIARWPILIPKLVGLQKAHPARLRHLADDTDAWWRTSVASRPDRAAAVRMLQEAAERFKMAMAVHSLQTSFAQAAYGKVAKMAAKAGAAGAEMDLATGSGALEELHVARDLWMLSRGQLPLDEFLAHHGYHGPNEGELSAHSWREDQAPVHAAIRSFEHRSSDEGPDAHAARKAEARQAALEKVLAGKGAGARKRTQAALDKAAKDVALREVGKAAFLKILDVGRYAARIVGATLVEEGQLDGAEDIFHLTLDEVSRTPSMPLRDIVAERTATRDRYLGLALPEYWTGTPTPIDVDDVATGDGRVAGIPASNGVAEGVARVVLDVEEDIDPLDSDEILVATTTDPGWLSLFMASGGMVVDVGGPMSHAAIVARELGIPCVINTIDGTRRIRTGDRIRVDGTTGTVEILATTT